MLDFAVQRCTRRCHASDRELAPGETFYSVLVADGAEVTRRDYAAEAWQGPPAGALGWWKSQMPAPHARKMHWAPNDVILHYFQQLGEETAETDIRYVLALLMIRRRIMRLEQTERDAQGQELLVLYCPRSDVEYRVAVVMPTAERVRAIQDELARLLYADAE
ncbi:MAG: hypothetical protein J5I93_01705 [Pirellulaceae bacterium]|nr:hypothetical protein [Pirellulaceae bacterium]